MERDELAETLSSLVHLASLDELADLDGHFGVVADRRGIRRTTWSATTPAGGVAHGPRLLRCLVEDWSISTHRGITVGRGGRLQSIAAATIY